MEPVFVERINLGDPKKLDKLIRLSNFPAAVSRLFGYGAAFLMAGARS